MKRLQGHVYLARSLPLAEKNRPILCQACQSTNHCFGQRDSDNSLCFRVRLRALQARLAAASSRGRHLYFANFHKKNKKQQGVNSVMQLIALLRFMTFDVTPGLLDA